MKPAGGLSRLLHNLRSLQVVVFHPDDPDGQELIAQLRRIGCQVKAFWPPLEKLPDEVGLIFFCVRPEVLAHELSWMKRDDLPPVVAVVNYENPLTIEAVLRLDAWAVIPAPVKSFGVMTSMVVALNQAGIARERVKYVTKLEQRLAGLRKIAKAKQVLMQGRNIGEEEAYKLIREQAMAKRLTTEQIADAIIKANDILGFDGKSGG